MDVINNTNKTLKFSYGKKEIILEPHENFSFDGFQIENQKEIVKLVKLGFLTIYDPEETEEIIPYDLEKNVQKSQKTIQKNNIDFFNQVDFDTEIQ